MQNHNDTITTSDTVLRKIYLSLYLKGLCVRGSWRPNRTATYWPPQLLWTWQCVFLVLPGCSTGGPGPSSLLGTVFSTASFLQLSWSPNCSIGDPEGPFCWVLFSLQHHFSNSPDPQTVQSGVPRAPSAGCCFLYSIISPTLLIPKLLNRGSRGPLLLGAVFSTASFLQLSWSPNCSIGDPEGPFFWVLFSLQHHFSNSLIPKLAIGICTSAVFWMACLIVIERK